MATVMDFFYSYYYRNTYLPPVDLSDKALASHVLENQELAEKVRGLIAQDPAVKNVFSSPLEYHSVEWIQNQNKILENKGFTLLSLKSNLKGDTTPFYSVVEHAEMPGWVIKSGAERIPEGIFVRGITNSLNEMGRFTKEDSLLRIEMAGRIRSIAAQNHITVIVPEKKLVIYDDEAVSPMCKYCVLSQKVDDLLSAEETINAIKEMPEDQQRELANQITIIVSQTGLIDASFANIRLNSHHQWVFIDTEPSGVMVAQEPGLWNRLFPSYGHSLEKAARLGLSVLSQQATALAAQAPDGKCGPFLEVLNERYEEVATPELSHWKIALSVMSLGLISVMNIIRAIAGSFFSNVLIAMDPEVAIKLKSAADEEEYNLFLSIQHWAKIKLHFDVLEGVPHIA